jgi:integrase
MKLDTRTVAGLKEPPPDKSDVIHFDDELPGFGLRLRSGGRRTWVVQYRVAGLTRRTSLGPAEALGVNEARKAARKILAQVLTGGDPQAERRRKREQAKITLRSVVETYLAAREGKLRSRTAFEITRYLTGERYFRALHSMPIEEIGRQHVAAQVMRIERESGAAAAIAARSALSAMFVWAMKTGVVQSNPLIGCYGPDVQPSRDRVLSDNELVTVWRACRDDNFGRIARLLILTGCRRQEVGGMAWDEFDRERGLWTIPGERTKNHRPHILPLPAAPWAIIDQVHRRTDRDLLFGDRANRGFSGWDFAKRVFDRRLGDAVAPWGLHDIRRSVATKMADLGVQPHIIEQVLNHQSGHKRGPAGIYNRSSYQHEVRAALALWADHVRMLIEGGERKVLSFPQSIA